VLAARTTEEAIALLRSGDARRVFSHPAATADRNVAFLFPGGGAQHRGMARDLHRAEPVFATHLDEGIRRLQETHGIDLRSLLLGDESAAGGTGEFELLAQQLPAIFLVEHAMAQLLLSWGIQPSAMAGHSVGENAAACVAGTMNFAECLDLVVLRGQLVDRVPGGTVVVPLTAEELLPLIEEHGLDLAVVNAPDLCVVSGSVDALAPFEG
jgi:acyl transferase domain-containing protein